MGNGRLLPGSCCPLAAVRRHERPRLAFRDSAWKMVPEAEGLPRPGLRGRPTKIQRHQTRFPRRKYRREDAFSVEYRQKDRKRYSAGQESSEVLHHENSMRSG